MTIRRKYSLPSCTLILEGLGDDAANTGNGRPVISQLIYAECQITGFKQALSGGQVFFNNLVNAVSAYAQEFLSGFPHPQEQESSAEVHLESLTEKNLHRLTWQPDADSQKKVEIDLTTVQFFDLAEAVDQFFADSQTLPNLSLSLQPLSKRYRRAEEPLVRRAAPAVIGTASVALAAVAFFFVPVPEVRKPEPVIESTPSETIPNPEEPLPGASPEPPSESEESSPAN